MSAKKPVGTEANSESIGHHTYATDFGLIPLPKRLRYDPEKPFPFGNLLHVSFGFASAFGVFSSRSFYLTPRDSLDDCSCRKLVLLPAIVKYAKRLCFVIIR
jgi:hypothetical protein